MIRTEEQIDKILAEVRRMWIKNPSLRLGQLIYNALSYVGYASRDDYFYAEDSRLILGLCKFQKFTEKKDVAEDNNS